MRTFTVWKAFMHIMQNTFLNINIGYIIFILLCLLFIFIIIYSVRNIISIHIFYTAINSFIYYTNYACIMIYMCAQYKNTCKYNAAL